MSIRSFFKPTFPIGVLLTSLWLHTGCRHGIADSAGSKVEVRPSTVQLRHLDYEYAVRPDSRGVPVIDWKVYRSREEKIVERNVPGMVLANRWFRATLIPEMGRLHSFIDETSGREQLWINPIAVPLGANNDTGFWMTWGGIEHVMPRREHGTSHALTWAWEGVELEGGWAGVRMTSVEPLTGLHHEVTYLANAEYPFLETRIEVSNDGPTAVDFSHWTTATLSPGGLGEVTERTEIIVPAEEFIPDDRDFNHWMKGMVGNSRTAPIRFVGRWKEIGDLMASPLQKGYYAVFAHEVGDGLVRAFSLSATPGFDIWGWGYPASERRQKEFTRAFPSKGYIEFWNGNVHGFKDHALAQLGPGESIGWVERLAPIHVSGDEALVRDQVSALADEMIVSLPMD